MVGGTRQSRFVVKRVLPPPNPMKKFLLALAAVMVLGGTSVFASDSKDHAKEEKKAECAACKEKGSMCDACKKKAEDKAKEHPKP